MIKAAVSMGELHRPSQPGCTPDMWTGGIGKSRIIVRDEVGGNDDGFEDLDNLILLKETLAGENSEA